MKLLIENNRIIATANDDYTGDYQTVAAPDGFNPERMGDYAVANGELIIPDPVLDQWEQIKAERDRRTQNGGYYVAPHWYHSDTFSRTQQLGLVLLGANIPAGTLWKTLDNGMIEMTQTLAGQIFGAAAASDIAIFAAAQAHKAAMESSPDPVAYDFSQGWPMGYGE
jgi:hypothetical protein